MTDQQRAILDLYEKLGQLTENFNTYVQGAGQHAADFAKVVPTIAESTPSVQACRLAIRAMVETHPEPERLRGALVDAIGRLHAAGAPLQNPSEMFAIERFLEELITQLPTSGGLR